MQKVLRKRILRDLKENIVRYLALGAMIVLCMYIIISLIGTADTIIIGSENAAQRNHLEDGQFTVFVPLTETQKIELESKGVTLEASTAKYSEAVPVVWNPITFSSSQRLYLPWRQG